MGFAYGILLAKYYDVIKSWTQEHWKRKSIIFLMLGAVFGCAYLKWKPVYFIGDYCLKILLGIVLLLLLLLITRKVQIGNKVLGFLGVISYEVYLVHRSVFTLTGEVIGVEESGAYIFITILISLLLAVGVKKCIETLTSVYRVEARKIKHNNEQK